MTSEEMFELHRLRAEIERLTNLVTSGNQQFQDYARRMERDFNEYAAEKDAEIEKLRAALVRAERKLSAYVGVCKGDKELVDTVLPMVRAALTGQENRDD